MSTYSGHESSTVNVNTGFILGGVDVFKMP